MNRKDERLIQEGIPSPKLEQVVRSVCRYAGIRPVEKNQQLLCQKLDHILRNHPSRDAYIASIEDPIWHNSSLFIEILDAVLTGESYFFRNTSHCQLISDVLIPDFLSKQRRPLKMWSAGCSTGEEAHTLNILAKRYRKDLTPDTLRIYASDINNLSLNIARKARYGEWSLRSIAPEKRENYFNVSESKYVLKPEYRDLVSFFQHNLIRDPFPSYLLGLEELDLIVCRNVLMYITGDDITRILEGFARTLNKQGYLIVDYSETHLLESSPFKPVSIDNTLVFQTSGKAATTGRKIPSPSMVEKLKLRYHLESSVPSRAVEKKTGKRKKSAPHGHTPSGNHRERVDILLPLARMEFLSGAFAQAEILLKQILVINELCDEAYYLMGLLNLEQNNTGEARNYLRRCLFLCPDHEGALNVMRTINHD